MANNLKVSRLRIKNFKAFREEIDIDFQNKNLLIYGNNGSGKSSLFWAIYTLLQSTTKDAGEIKKYFKKIPLDDTKQSLRNIFEDDSENSYVLLNIDGDTNDYKISFDDIENLDSTNIKTLNATSDFINYKLLSNFYNYSHKYELNLWAIFERDVFPFLTESVSNDNFLDYIKSKTLDAPRYSGGHYFRKGWRKDSFNIQLENVNNKVKNLLSEIETVANSFIKEHFTQDEEKIKIKLEYDRKFNFDLLKKRLWNEENKHIRHEELRIKLLVEQKDSISGNWKSIERIQSTLNEAQLTRIALSIRIGALRSRIQNLYPKILVLDDLLISLDMSNRIDVTKIILNVENKASLKFFDEFQKIILTHDKGFFKILQNYTNDSEWNYYNLFKEENSNDTPIIKPDKNHLAKASEFLSRQEYDACGNELRKEMETTLKKYLKKGQNIVADEFVTLKSMLKSAYEKFTVDERRNFEKTFLSPSISPEDLVKIKTDFENDVLLSDEIKGKLRSLKTRLFNYAIKMNEITLKRDLIFNDLNVFLDRIMNPASHSTTETLYEQELKNAIELITNFKNEIEK